ncbi:cold-shock protein [Phyllobacterium zundukense]|uniref:Cold-shock protein n=1 Tax=Phyllobacterium zundukense TaxID=1867719 RepID=A0ACD4CVU7_9HYPH|nr:cold-shock protein [Phyllobacterium zundukense]UXN57699.1 cold-shock protein [Phyllobacterium zundukense]
MQPYSARAPAAVTPHGIFIQPDDGGADVFVHISAVERAGLRGLNDGQKIKYEIVQDRRSGKSSADNLSVD